MGTGVDRPVFDLRGSLGLLKRGLRSSAARVARLSGTLARRERACAGALTVLTYHRVLPEERCAGYPFPGLVMPLGAFREQVRWLAAHGEVLPLSEALARELRPAGPPVFALTFDDGYHDAGEHVAGVLAEAGVRATFFVTTGFVGTRELLWFDRAVLLFAAVAEPVRLGIVLEVLGARLADTRPGPGADAASWTRHLKLCTPRERGEILSSLELAAGGALAPHGFRGLSVAELVGLHRAGHEVGSHTVSHALLPDLDDHALQGELEGARDAIAGWVGGSVHGFCYPNGDHDERTIAAVVRAGHAYACTTSDGLHAPGGDPFRIPRVDIVPQRVTDASRRLDLAAFRGELCGLYRRRD
jgi:peptidoglycan/xylan/chitin deacetylase (PgdA/CDA1 family)